MYFKMHLGSINNLQYFLISSLMIQQWFDWKFTHLATFRL